MYFVLGRVACYNTVVVQPFIVSKECFTICLLYLLYADVFALHVELPVYGAVYFVAFLATSEE